MRTLTLNSFVQIISFQMIRSNTNWVCLRESEDEDGNEDEDGEKSRTKGNRIKDRKKKKHL